MIQIHGLTLTASLVVQLISALIPWLVALLVHVNAPGWFKSGLHAVLAAVLGAVGVLVGANGGYDWQAFVQAILSTLVVSGMTYVVVARKIGGPQLEAAGISLGKSLIMGITKQLPTDAKAPAVTVTELPQDQTPPTGNVIKTPPNDAGYTPISTLAYLLIVLGIVGLVIGLIARHVTSMAAATWTLWPGVIVLVVGVLLAVLFGPAPGSGYWYRGRRP